MIRFTLACDRGHDFESWFPSGASYDEQAAAGLVRCPICDSGRVAKAPMAPSIARGGKPPASREPDPAPVAEPSVPTLSDTQRGLRAMLRAMREHVTRTADHVGPRFAQEARAMHYGEVETRSIYGEASAEDAHALIEEGIEVCPLPPTPDDRN